MCFRFGDGSYKLLGTFFVRVPVPNGSVFEQSFDVVQADVPILIGLDVINENRLVADNDKNNLRCPNCG